MMKRFWILGLVSLCLAGCSGRTYAGEAAPTLGSVLAGAVKL